MSDEPTTEPTGALDIIEPSAPTEPASAEPAPAPAPSEPELFQWPDEYKETAEKKGWKTANDALRSYVNLEKHMGVPPDKLIKLTDYDDPERRSEIWDKFGAPKEASEYGIDLDKADEEEKAFLELAAKHRITKEQVSPLLEELREANQKRAADYEAQFKAQVLNAKEELQKEWGQAHAANMDIARRGAKELGEELGFTKDEIADLEGAIGTTKLIKLMHHIGKQNTEHTFTDSGNNTASIGGMTPAQAREQLAALEADTDFQKRLFSVDPSISRAAQEERRKYFQIANS